MILCLFTSIVFEIEILSKVFNTVQQALSENFILSILYIPVITSSLRVIFHN